MAKADIMTSVMPAAQGAQVVAPAAIKQSAPTFMTPTITQINVPAILSSTLALVAPENSNKASSVVVPAITPLIPVASAPTAVPVPTAQSAIATPIANVRIDAKAFFDQWRHLLLGTATFIEIVTFIEQHPTWPKQSVLCEKAENVLEDPGADPVAAGQVIEFFDRYHPKTGKGQFYYAKALLVKGKIDQAKQEFYKLLVSFPIPTDIIVQLVNYKQYLPFLWAYLHASNLLYTKHSRDATALLGYLTPDEKERISLRLDLLAKKSDAAARAQKLISKAGNNEGVIFELIRYYRQLKTPEGTEAAVQLFINNTFLDEEQHASVFWKERNLLARRMMDAKRPIDAYTLVKKHGFKINKEKHFGEIRCGEECAHAHCMTGWLALNYANKPEKALGVFKGIETVVKEAISKSRVHYWIGESYLKLNQLSEAKKAFLEASTYSTTFYGQMAASQIANAKLKDQHPIIKNVSFKAVLEVTVPPAEKAAFENLELVQVIRSVSEARKGHNCDSFFFALLKISQTLAFQRQVFDLAKEKKGEAYAILLAKKKHMTFRVAYPLLRAETRKSTVSRIVPKSRFGSLLMPLSHAIIRRESGFDEYALSSANARGMMQLTPATAKEEARAIKRFGINLSSKMNLYEKNQNITLGTSHIESLLDNYNGSLVLSLAAYNAGPKPVSEWIRDYGDPRLPDVDIVHWIECIPYAETRNYVQRVLENFMVYKQFLHEETTGTLGVTIGSHELSLLSYLKG
ncbi:MAG: transglycosylase SLT domain-containing protein [Pseudomonadota bacterium]